MNISDIGSATAESTRTKMLTVYLPVPVYRYLRAYAALVDAERGTECQTSAPDFLAPETDEAIYTALVDAVWREVPL